MITWHRRTNLYAFHELEGDLEGYLISKPAGGFYFALATRGRTRACYPLLIQGVLGAPGKPQGLDRMAQEGPGEIGRRHFWQFRGAVSSGG
jgi:hypothetical protein